jgi:hypothetical protein
MKKVEQINFQINAKDMTIELSMAKLIMPEIKVGAYLDLKNIIHPGACDIIDIIVKVIPDAIYN